MVHGETFLPPESRGKGPTLSRGRRGRWTDRGGLCDPRAPVREDAEPEVLRALHRAEEVDEERGRERYVPLREPIIEEGKS